MNKPVIICVDDEAIVLQSLKIELKKALGEDYLIETEEESEDALELIAELLEEKNEIPLVISDYFMPGLKGDELLKKIHIIAPKTIKIMLTGQADIAAVSNTIKYAKLYRYIAKPWQAEDLRLTIKEAINSYFLEKQIQEQNIQLQKLNYELENLVEERTSALRLSEEKFAKAFRSSPNPITITRLTDGCHIEINEAFCNMIGYTKEEIIGRTAVDLELWASLESRKELFTRLVEFGAVRNYEFDFFTKNKEKRTALLSAEIIEINEQKCVISVSQDISDRKQAEIALQKAKEAADKANRAKSEFLSNMSHELRTPLNAILGFTQLLLRDTSLKADQQQQLGIISRSGEHLLNLINNILQMSKIEVGLVTVNPNTFDLYRMLLTIEEMFKLQAEKKGLQLNFWRSDNLPQYIYTDESKLRQVLINLLGNGIKFTTEGGVNLRVKVLKTTPVHPQVKHNNDTDKYQLLFEIEDTGGGISAEDIDILFTPFVQTETGRKSQEGTGLGLPISRKFIQLLGGDISVTSEVNKGSIFKFDIEITIPDAIEIQATGVTRRAIRLEPGQPEYRILVVDDRSESRLLLTKLLSSLGFAVKSAENGLQAVDIWSNWEPHLIWMDMRMPIMDGYEATKRIKAHLKGQATVIIALTASAFDEEKSVILSAGCDDFVAKPFREHIILEKMAKYLGVRYIYEKISTLEKENEKDGSPGLENSNSNSNNLESSFILNSHCFQDFPPEWVEELYQAADAVDNDQIQYLISQLPPDRVNLGTALFNLANNFRCDKIIDLIDRFRKI